MERPCLQTRAKAIRKYVDKMIQLAKVGTLHSRRQARAVLLPHHEIADRVDVKSCNTLAATAHALSIAENYAWCSYRADWFELSKTLYLLSKAWFLCKVSAFMFL